MANAASTPNLAAAFTYQTGASGNAPSATQTASTAQTPPAAPTLQSEFGSQPYLDNPTGTSPTGSYNFNPIYFATPQTAAQVASLVGGTVVERNDMVTGGPFHQKTRSAARGSRR